MQNREKKINKINKIENERPYKALFNLRLKRNLPLRL